MVRRRPGMLLSLEIDLLGVAVEVQQSGQDDCYGYALAKALAADGQARRMIAHGTLYKALGRMTDAGLLDSWWEDPAIAEVQGRPRRRLYRVTGAGVRAWTTAVAGAPQRRAEGSAAPGTVVPGTATA